MKPEMRQWALEGVALDAEIAANAKLLTSAALREQADQIAHLRRIAHSLLDRQIDANLAFQRAIKKQLDE